MPDLYKLETYPRMLPCFESDPEGLPSSLHFQHSSVLVWSTMSA